MDKSPYIRQGRIAAKKLCSALIAEGHQLAATLEHDDESRDSGVLETLGILRSEAVKRQELIVDKKDKFSRNNEEVKSIAASGIVALLRLEVDSFDSDGLEGLSGQALSGETKLPFAEKRGDGIVEDCSGDENTGDDVTKLNNGVEMHSAHVDNVINAEQSDDENDDDGDDDTVGIGTGNCRICDDAANLYGRENIKVLLLRQGRENMSVVFGMITELMIDEYRRLRGLKQKKVLAAERCAAFSVWSNGLRFSAFFTAAWKACFKSGPITEADVKELSKLDTTFDSNKLEYHDAFSDNPGRGFLGGALFSRWEQMFLVAQREEVELKVYNSASNDELRDIDAETLQYIGGWLVYKVETYPYRKGIKENAIELAKRLREGNDFRVGMAVGILGRVGKRARIPTDSFFAFVVALHHQFQTCSIES